MPPIVRNTSDMELEVPAIGATLGPGDSIEVGEDDAPLFYGHGVLELTGWAPPAVPVPAPPAAADEPEEGNE